MVTGVNGFVGHHLANELKQRDIYVVGVAHTEPDAEIKAHLDEFISCDLTKPEEVAKLDFGTVDAVIHLAALASPALSFEQPQLFISANSAMVINVFERALSQKLENPPRFIMVSSGTVYDGHQPLPITEAGKLTHGSPYSISKLLGEGLADYYDSRGLDSIVVRPFNHTGPGQMPGFILPDIAEQLAKIGPDGTLHAGNLDSRRDYTDVRDIVKAYAELAVSPNVKHRLYNACSGQSHSGRELVDLVARSLYGDKANIKIELDPSRVRPNDPEEIIGSNQRLQDDLGWKPTIPFEQTIHDFVNQQKDL